MPEPTPGAAAAPSVSILMPVHDAGAHLRACVRRLRAPEPSPDECIVVD